METIKVEMKTQGLHVDINQEEFALALKTWRLRQDLTQKQLAERWNVTRFTIIRAEHAKNLTWMMAYKLYAKLADELKKEEQS